MPPLCDWPLVRQRGRGAPHHPPGWAAACAPPFPHPGQCSRRRLLGRPSLWSGNEWAFLSCLFFFFFLSPVLGLSPSTRGGRRPVRGAGAPWSARRNWGGRPRGEGGQRADTAPGGGDRRRRCRRRCCHRVRAGGGATPPPRSAPGPPSRAEQLPAEAQADRETAATAGHTPTALVGTEGREADWWRLAATAGPPASSAPPHAPLPEEAGWEIPPAASRGDRSPRPSPLRRPSPHVARAKQLTAAVTRVAGACLPDGGRCE